MGSKYSVEIENGQTSASIVRASGSLKLAAAAIKEGLAEIAGKDGDFHATFVEVESVNGAEKRQVLRLTAEADIVSTVLKKRLAAEKKAEGDLPGERVDSDPLESGDSTQLA